MNLLRKQRSLASGAKQLSKRVILSYVLDWFFILAVFAAGAGISKVHGNRHAFSLDDLSISYPYSLHETVSDAVLIVVSLVIPAVLLFVLSMVLVPGPTADVRTSSALRWRRKVWEWNTAWMGLGVAIAGTFFFTEGLKDLSGKPRPDLLARCNPDLSPSAIAKYRVGGIGGVRLVTWHICQSTGSTLNDGFASWPSGHASWSWSGLLYLSLWLCSKFNIAVPFLAPSQYSTSEQTTFSDETAVAHPRPRHTLRENKTNNIPARNQAAAPPVTHLIIGLTPIAVAFFICISRYSDYRHAGFDIISGAVLGASFAYLGFRWYHMPIRRGAGWSWGARSRDRAFFAGVGRSTYVSHHGWESTSANGPSTNGAARDLESQEAMATRAGMEDNVNGRET